jgi:hypothetical protein
MSSPFWDILFALTGTDFVKDCVAVVFAVAVAVAVVAASQQ